MNAPTLKRTRILNTTLVAALLAASGAAQAGPGRGDADGFTARAKVLASAPVYETINEPRRECWTETVGYETRRESGTAGGAIHRRHRRRPDRLHRRQGRWPGRRRRRRCRHRRRGGRPLEQAAPATNRARSRWSAAAPTTTSAR
jgi:hypothetical protein